MFGKLEGFKKKHGHPHITESYQDRQLYDWLVYQRKLSWRGKLDEEKINRLTLLGVDMKNKTADRWEQMFDELVKFKKRHHHLYVCRYYGASKQMVNFVKVSRKNMDKMFRERKKKLDAIGFVWNPGMEVTKRQTKDRSDQAWMARFEELKAYKQKFGTTWVVIREGKYFSLGNWCSVQRRRKEKLPGKRYKMLEQIGFWEENNK